MSDFAGSGWDGVNVLQSSWCGAVFGICGQDSLGNTAVLLLLLSSAGTASRPSLAFVLPWSAPCHLGIGWGREHIWHSCPELPRLILHTT